MVPESLILGSTLGINQNKWALKASQMRLFFICCHIFGIGIIVYDFSKFFPNLLKKTNIYVQPISSTYTTTMGTRNPNFVYPVP